MTRIAETYPTLSLAERDRRWALLRNFLTEKGLDCLVVFGLPERQPMDRYITNFVTGTAVLPRQGNPVLMSPRGYALTQHLEVSANGETPLWLTDVRRGSTGKDLVALFKDLGYERANIGVVGLSMGLVVREGWIPYGTWTHVLRELPEANFVDVTYPFVELIAVKSEEELAMIRKAADVAELACEEMLRTVKPGVRESDVVAAVMHVIHSHGAVGSLLPHLGPLILQSGANSPAAGPPRWVVAGGEPRTLERGDFIHAEIFAIYGGYEAQAHMGISVGPPDEHVRKGSEIARASYLEGVKALVPGNHFSDVAEAMRSPLQAAGVGHPGVLIHSLNTISFSSQSDEGLGGVLAKYKLAGAGEGRGGDVLLRAGMTFEVEPKCLVEGRGVYLGGTVIVSEGGALELNQISTRVHSV